MMTPRYHCASCEFWRRDAAREIDPVPLNGECWLDPPRVVGFAQAQGSVLGSAPQPVKICALPSTRSTDGCSRHSFYSAMVQS